MDFPAKATAGIPEDKRPAPTHSHPSCQGPLQASPGLPPSQDPGFLHSLKMTMDKAGLLLLSSPDRVTIGLLFWDGPGQGLRLLLRDTDRFSSHVSGTLGMLPRAPGWASSEATSAFE